VTTSRDEFILDIGVWIFMGHTGVNEWGVLVFNSLPPLPLPRGIFSLRGDPDFRRPGFVIKHGTDSDLYEFNDSMRSQLGVMMSFDADFRTVRKR